MTYQSVVDQIAASFSLCLLGSFRWLCWADEDVKDERRRRPSQLRRLQTLIIVSEKDTLHPHLFLLSFTTQHEEDLGGNDEGDLLRQGGERPHVRLPHGTFSSWREDRFLHAEGEKGRSPKGLATHVTASVPLEESPCRNINSVEHKSTAAGPATMAFLL
ncbi:hypothetical protein BHE74_00055637 [Ensete ventricosum]|nr:hypothetical protein BHE74_00055637 [Ensete ventricosum]RZS26355.1 hypothetical protein BHM03_00059687 [Ensete ventricosum]